MAKKYEYFTIDVNDMFIECFEQENQKLNAVQKAAEISGEEALNLFLSYINKKGAEGWICMVPHFMTGIGTNLLFFREKGSKKSYLYESKSNVALFAEYYLKNFPDEDPYRRASGRPENKKIEDFIEILNTYGDTGWYLAGPICVAIRGMMFYIFMKEGYKSAITSK